MPYLIGLCLLFVISLTGCDLTAVNSPYPDVEDEGSVLYTSFSLRPKHLDPARSYSSNETSFTGQIYEPPYQYHYLKRPYTLIPLTATDLPTIKFFDEEGNQLADLTATKDVAFSIYEITIKPDILYQPHPAFVRNKLGHFSYHQLTSEQLDDITTLSDFDEMATRELVAEDYVYQIKRLAHPDIHSPILGLMSDYIVGLGGYAKKLQQLRQSGNDIDLKETHIDGVTAIDKYTYQIKVKGKYPQLRYWLAMPFFAPVPWEADAFYDQAGLVKKNISMDWFPVGTGPYHLTENDPNSRMVLSRNPNFHGEQYPIEGEAIDQQMGLLLDAGKSLPFIDKIIFTLEKENTSYWNKFIQGYYDVSGISSDSFDQAIQVASTGEFGLSEAMKHQGIELETAIGTSTSYIGFNMLDPVVGGYSEQAKKLRQALSIAIDYEEFISIFTNGRGIAAQSPIPPGIFGYVEGERGINPYVYDWVKNSPKRKPLSVAKQLLVEAGYPEGRHHKTGEPLVLYFDVPASGPDAKANLDWLRKQFQKLDIQLVIRSTDYNRFQDKMRLGQAQVFQWGWNADYPDPENFLFLLYGPNAKASSAGENASNYHNDEFDKLFEQMAIMPDGEQRQQIIQKMLKLIQQDSPWVWGFHPKQFALYHSWNKNVKSNLMANNTMKYRDIDVEMRERLQREWNQPLLWPVLAVFIVLFILLLPALLMYRHKKHAKLRLCQ